MVEPFTLEQFQKGSIIFVSIYTIIIIGITIYTLYLNWKQSKVKDTQQEIISLLKEILKEMRKGKK
tara:strand:+ start:4088 stop:4285 length:198 start_codon:yes stop_codon:yes gene_type:complete